MQVNVHEAKTKLSRLLELVESGESVIIARNGQPVARLVSVSMSASFPFGIASGSQLVPPGDSWWDAMSDAEADEWASGK